MATIRWRNRMQLSLSLSIASAQRNLNIALLARCYGEGRQASLFDVWQSRAITSLRIHQIRRTRTNSFAKSHRTHRRFSRNGTLFRHISRPPRLWFLSHSHTSDDTRGFSQGIRGRLPAFAPWTTTNHGGNATVAPAIETHAGVEQFACHHRRRLLPVVFTRHLTTRPYLGRSFCHLHRHSRRNHSTRQWFPNRAQPASAARWQVEDTFCQKQPNNPSSQSGRPRALGLHAQSWSRLRPRLFEIHASCCLRVETPIFWNDVDERFNCLSYGARHGKRILLRAFGKRQAHLLWRDGSHPLWRI